MADRIILLEEKLAFLERRLGDLDEVLRHAHRRIDLLEEKWKSLRTVQESKEGVDPDPEV